MQRESRCHDATGPAGDAPDERQARFVRVTVLDEIVRAGGAARLELENLSERRIGYNLCNDQDLEVWLGTRWVDLDVPREGVCPDILFLLPPGGTDDAAATVPAGLPAGTYRFHFGGIDFEDQGRGLLPSGDRKSNSFRVVP